MAVALKLAVTDNQTNIVEALIGHMDAKAVNQHSLPLGRTLLHVAVRHNNVAIARMLLDAGAKVDATTDDNLTPIHIAIGNQSSAMLALLLEYNANVNPSKLFNGRTPLYMAVEYCCESIVMMLLDNGARIGETTMICGGSDTALHLALSMRSDRIAELLIRYATEEHVNIKRSIDGKTPLYLAIENGQFDLVVQLIKKGAKFDELYTSQRTDEDENVNVMEVCTPLTLAVRRGDDNIVALLLRHGAANSLSSCLHEAIKLRCKKITELLLANSSVSIDCCVDGKTALYLAAECGYIDMVKVCLSHNASIKDLGDRTTPLLYEGVKSNDTELIELLLKRGAPVNAFVYKRIRLLDVAVKARFITMTKLLLKNGAFINEASPPGEKLFAIKYAVLLLAEGHKVRRENQRLIRSEHDLNAFYELCRAELKRAKTDEIISNVTFFDLLTGDEDTLASYAKKDEFIEAFPSCGYRTNYKVYVDTIALNYAKGRLRNALLVKATADYEKEFGLPLANARTVFKLMTNDDLQNFIRTFCNCENDAHHRCLPEIFVQF